MTLPTLIAKLEEALKAATPEPWREAEGDLGDDMDRLMDPEDHHMVSTKMALVAEEDTSRPVAHIWGFGWDDTELEANARLIALMRNSLPTLIEALKRQGEALEFYADRKNYHDTPLPNNQWKTATVVFDGGKLARAALTAHKETPDV